MRGVFVPIPVWPPGSEAELVTEALPFREKG